MLKVVVPIKLADLIASVLNDVVPPKLTLAIASFTNVVSPSRLAAVCVIDATYCGPSVHVVDADKDTLLIASCVIVIVPAGV